MKAYYDLHIHSCLSPCGDNEMTPNNIVNMAVLKGLDIIALTDHNSCKNCPAMQSVADKAGIIFVAGMELCTAEECHVLCLFPTINAAMEFDRYVGRSMPPIENSPDIFGEQLVMDGDDQVTGSVSVMLSAASAIGIDELVPIVAKYGGAIVLSHIDRPSFSVLSNLGTVPDLGFDAFELTTRDTVDLVMQYPVLEKRPLLFNSDAHMLSQIQEKGPWIEIESPNASALIAALNSQPPAHAGIENILGDLYKFPYRTVKE